MFTVIIAGFLVWALISFIERNQEDPIDDWLCFGLVLSPALMIWILTIIGGILGVPPLLYALALMLYFIIPTAMLRTGLELTWERSCAYGGLVFVTSVIVEISLGYGLAMLSAS